MSGDKGWFLKDWSVYWWTDRALYRYFRKIIRQWGVLLKIFKNKDSFIYRFINLFIKCEITAASAEMAYYLVFAFFPLMMIIHASFSMVLHEFSMDDTFFYNMVPNLVEDLLNTYIQYISAHSNLSFLLLGIFLTVYTLSKFMKSTKRTIRKIYGSDGYSNPIAEWSVSILLSVIVVFAFFYCVCLGICCFIFYCFLCRCFLRKIWGEYNWYWKAYKN